MILERLYFILLQTIPVRQFIPEVKEKRCTSLLGVLELILWVCIYILYKSWYFEL